MNYTRLTVGDTVKLGHTAREKHYVLSPPQGDYVEVRQCSTGKVRVVRRDRCVVVSKAATRLT
jgi:DNA-binding beta-propeller fold protein YncE